MPDKIATYINEQKVSKVSDAAVLAEEYILTQRDTFEKFHSFLERSVPVSRPFVLLVKPSSGVEVRPSEW